IAAELSDRCADHLAVLQQRADVAPLEVQPLSLVFAAAAGLDVGCVSAVGGLALARVVIERPPHEAEEDPEPPDDEEQAAPAELLRDPEQGNAKEAETEVHADRIGRFRPRALVLREPRRENPAVGRKTRRLEDA